MTVTIRADFSFGIKQLDDIQKRQVPFAAKNALNALAYRVIADEQDEMRSVFNNPTNWTLNSLFVRQHATKENLTAIVDFKDSPKNRSAGKYLAAQINGGSRRTKAVERFFIANNLMPSGMKIVPASSLKLDAHGNITRSAFKAMVRGVRAGTHFVLLKKHGRLNPGLYRRYSRTITSRVTGESVKLRVQALLFYVSEADYQKRLRHHEIAAESVAAHQEATFEQELAKAFRTAR